MSGRPARFAGSWYPGDPAALRAELEAARPSDLPDPTPARAVIAPHAGYRFSLAIAQAAYARVALPDAGPLTAVVLCPNHTVREPAVAVWPEGSWRTPLGEVPLDEALTARLLDEVPDATPSAAAHAREHAVELQLPILQQRHPDLRLVALVVAASRRETLVALGEGLARAVAGREDVLLVASTDMTHYEPAEQARSKDERALEHVLALDPEGLLETCARERISMCGARPTAAVLVAARALGATAVELARYGHSGEVTGDHERVVGYAGLVVR